MVVVVLGVTILDNSQLELFHSQCIPSHQVLSQNCVSVSLMGSCESFHLIPRSQPHLQPLPGVTASVLPKDPRAPCTASPYLANCPLAPSRSPTLEYSLQVLGRHCDSIFGPAPNAMIVKLRFRCPGPRNTRLWSRSDSIHRTSSAATRRSCFASWPHR